MRCSIALLVIFSTLLGPVGCSSDDPTEAPDPDPLLAEYVINGPEDLFPEGIAFDARTRRFFVGSLTSGEITAIAADGTQSVFYPAPAGGEGSSAGLDVDLSRRRLVACASDGPAAGSQVWFIDLDSGQRLGAVDLADAFAGATCNDLALDSAGRAFVTDSKNPNLYLAELGAGASLWATGGLLDPSKGELPILGLNGIAVSPDDSTVIATKYHPARLIALPMENPEAMSDVTLTGDPYPGSAIAGADGMLFLEQDLFVVFAGAVKQVRFSSGFSAGEVKTIPAPITTGLSTGVAAEGQLFAVKSEVVHFSLKTPPELPYKILRIDLN
jgi:sugar lactone lactonase YvrE